MSKVLVIDTLKRPINPIHPGEARLLLNQGKAAVYRRYPFTIILKEAHPDEEVQTLRLKLDPGSKTTGIAVVNDSTGEVVLAAELTHRGFAIQESLTARRAIRRNRRNRHTRYRQARFLNRTRKKGWLPPSLEHRVLTINTWVKRLKKYGNITAISQELVKFDLQQLENPEISGTEYQQGELAGYEVREYLLEKWSRKCAYCGVENQPLQIEHIHPRSKGGSDRVSNLTIACEKCNQKKGNKSIADFLKKKPDVLKRILNQAKSPLKDATAVNATRWKLFETLKEHGLPVEVGSGGSTKFNRIKRNLAKSHWVDAACVGSSTPNVLKIDGIKPLIIKATGHGTRQMCRTDKHGFPSRYVPRDKSVKGFQTGDIVKAVVTSGKKIGKHVGRVAVRSTGSFNISTATGLVQGIGCKYCNIVHRKDGYSYSFKAALVAESFSSHEL